MRRVVESARLQAAVEDQLEFVFYVDDDDDTFPTELLPLVRVVRGPRIALSLMSNACLPAVSGDVIMYAGDDLHFVSRHWDMAVLTAFEQVPDHIVLVHGDDLGQDPRKLATHGFVHRRWIEIVGYLIPPYFPADWADTWLTHVADRISRRLFLPDVHIEHEHYAWGKGVVDQTHADRLARIGQDHLASRYRRLRAERRLDAQKLRVHMDGTRLPTMKRFGVPAWWLPSPGTRVLHRPRWLQ